MSEMQESRWISGFVRLQIEISKTKVFSCNVLFFCWNRDKFTLKSLGLLSLQTMTTYMYAHGYPADLSRMLGVRAWRADLRQGEPPWPFRSAPIMPEWSCWVRAEVRAGAQVSSLVSKTWVSNTQQHPANTLCYILTCKLGSNRYCLL